MKNGLCGSGAATKTSNVFILYDETVGFFLEIDISNGAGVEIIPKRGDDVRGGGSGRQGLIDAGSADRIEYEQAIGGNMDTAERVSMKWEFKVVQIDKFRGIERIGNRIKPSACDADFLPCVSCIACDGVLSLIMKTKLVREGDGKVHRIFRVVAQQNLPLVDFIVMEIGDKLRRPD